MGVRGGAVKRPQKGNKYIEGITDRVWKHRFIWLVNVSHYKRTVYNVDVMRQTTACVVVNPNRG